MNPTEYVIALSESPKADFGKKAFSDQSEPQKVFTTVFGSSGAIMMDGLALYISNSDGESAHFAVAAYKAIGSPKRADILERAFKTVSANPIPAGDDERQALIAALDQAQADKLEELDREFMTLPEQIDPLLLEYVRKHPREFGPVPSAIC